jgi:hypothetical protein
VQLAFSDGVRLAAARVRRGMEGVAAQKFICEAIILPDARRACFSSRRQFGAGKQPIDTVAEMHFGGIKANSSHFCQRAAAGAASSLGAVSSCSTMKWIGTLRNFSNTSVPSTMESSVKALVTLPNLN